jgi:hypothetical protein
MFLCLCDRCDHDRSQAQGGVDRDIVARVKFYRGARIRETEFLVATNLSLRRVMLGAFSNR